ncbi:MAG TPA: rhodanese-like domain-containing protein [Polyangia bacterium]|jgi:rhodanese-related sulfurtransferase|nr:rhodanese-like domain-containing protein [Polyangia bacterium]
MFGTIVGRALCLLLAGSALGLAVNAARPDGVRFTKFAPPNTCGGGEAGAAPGAAPVEVLPPAVAASLCGDAQTLLADVRPPDEFAEGHVTGAIHLPCASSGSAASAAVDRLAGRHTLVVYGDGTEDAKLVAEELRRRAGRPDLRVLVIEGGFAAWSRAGLACSSGPCPECGVPHEHK